jgi:hypothetical protein
VKEFTSNEDLFWYATISLKGKHIVYVCVLKIKIKITIKKKLVF